MGPIGNISSADVEFDQYGNIVLVKDWTPCSGRDVNITSAVNNIDWIGINK